MEIFLVIKEVFFAALLLFAPMWVAMVVNAVWKVVSDHKNSKRIAKRNAEKALREERRKELEYIEFLGENL